MIDVDGPDQMEEAQKLGLLAEPTWVTTTGRSDGGYHLWFRHPGGEIGNETIPGTLLQVRADHGYVVLGGSIHPDTGNRYEFDQPCFEPLELPPDVLTLLSEMSEPRQNL